MTTDDDFLLAQIQDAQRERNDSLSGIKKCDMCNRIGRVKEGLCQVCQVRYKDDKQE